MVYKIIFILCLILLLLNEGLHGHGDRITSETVFLLCVVILLLIKDKKQKWVSGVVFIAYMIYMYIGWDRL